MQKLINAVEKHKSLVLETERHIWKNPETGYKEVKTSAYLQQIFERLGYELTLAGDIHGSSFYIAQPRADGKALQTLLLRRGSGFLISHTKDENDLFEVVFAFKVSL